MEQLDNNKIPKLLSAGQKYHDSQMVSQLPRHDLAAEYCRHLKTDVQRKSFEEFCTTRNTEALDFGRVVTSVPSASVRKRFVLFELCHSCCPTACAMATWLSVCLSR